MALGLHRMHLQMNIKTYYMKKLSRTNRMRMPWAEVRLRHSVRDAVHWCSRWLLLGCPAGSISPHTSLSDLWHVLAASTVHRGGGFGEGEGSRATHGCPSCQNLGLAKLSFYPSISHTRGAEEKHLPIIWRSRPIVLFSLPMWKIAPGGAKLSHHSTNSR